MIGENVDIYLVIQVVVHHRLDILKGYHDQVIKLSNNLKLQHIDITLVEVRIYIDGYPQLLLLNHIGIIITIDIDVISVSI
jgi:ribosome-associated translation inhibitor RaiA